MLDDLVIRLDAEIALPFLGAEEKGESRYETAGQDEGSDRRLSEDAVGATSEIFVDEAAEHLGGGEEADEPL